jgi:nucleoside-diphosphate-sugar epimerase
LIDASIVVILTLPKLHCVVSFVFFIHIDPMSLHTIIDVNRSLAGALIPVLLARGETVRLIAPVQMPLAQVEWRSSDLYHYEQVVADLGGSSVVYLLTTLPDLHFVHEHELDLMMNNILNACKETRARLVYLDASPVYGKTDGAIRESSVVLPLCHTGRLYLQANALVLQEMERRKISATIARMADVYGAGYPKGKGGNKVFHDLLEKGKASWYIDAGLPVAFHYAPDIASALYLLATREQALGEVWNLPVPAALLTAREFIALAARAMDQRPGVWVMPRWMIGFQTLIDPLEHEAHHHYGYPVVIDAGKFEKKFHPGATSWQAGMQHTAHWFLQGL